MEQADQGEIRELRERLSKLSEASLRINESLDFETVLQGVLDSARSLTGARYGVIILLDDAGGIQDFLTSGLTPEETRRLWEVPGGRGLFEYVVGTAGPLRVRDFQSHMRSLGLAELSLPMPVGAVFPFLAAPVRHRGEGVGNFFLAQKEGGGEFTPEDEETLAMFASQAALVIANARRYRDEQRARADLETLINTAPVGVVVFEGRTGAPVSFAPSTAPSAPIPERSDGDCRPHGGGPVASRTPPPVPGIPEAAPGPSADRAHDTDSGRG